MKMTPYYTIQPEWRDGVGCFRIWSWGTGKVVEVQKVHSIGEARIAIERHKKEEQQRADFLHQHSDLSTIKIF